MPRRSHPGARCASLHQNIVAVDDVLVAHGVAAYFKGEDIAVAHHIVQRDALRRLEGLDRHAGGDASGQRQPVAGAGSRPGGSTSMERLRLCTRSNMPFLFKVGNVLMHGCQALQPHAARNLLKRRGIAVASHERLQEIENLFLPTCDSHARIIANKKRTAQYLFLRLLYGGETALKKSSAETDKRSWCARKSTPQPAGEQGPFMARFDDGEVR